MTEKQPSATSGRVLVLSLLATCSLAGCRVEKTTTPPAASREQSSVTPVPAGVEPGAPAAPFTLTDQTGTPFDSTRLRGRVWVASVFFANCPGPCFRENQAIADVLRGIDDPDLVAVSLTCDPDNDTPEVLRRYADRFGADPARWKFLTGDMDTIRSVANKTLQLPAEVGVHSERGVVFDRQGRNRGSYHLLQPDRVELLVKMIRQVLAEPADEGAGVETPRP